MVWCNRTAMSGQVSALNYLFVAFLLQTSVLGLHYVDPQHNASLEHKPHPNQTESVYSGWSPWSSCSRSCGTGISVRTRSCNKRASSTRNSDHLCLSDTTEHKICNLQPCPNGSPTSLAFQCSQYNNRSVAGQRGKLWLPTQEGSNPCELRCMTEGVVSGFGKVADGTPCNDGVCLDGRCLKVGCDEKLGSGAELDMCGICSGRNITCVHYKNVFTEQLSEASNHERRSAYREVVVIPIGARNLEIRNRLGENVLAIRDRSTAILYHGKERVSPNRRHIAGTIISYSKEDQNRTEVLRAVDPVTAELYVLVLLRERNQGIFYQYWIPLSHPRSAYYNAPLPQLSFTTNSYHTTARPHWSGQTSTLAQRPPDRHHLGDFKTTPKTFRKTTLAYSRLTTAATGLNYGPKRRVLPSYVGNSVSSSPMYSENSLQHFTASDTVHSFTKVRNNLPPVYNRNYRTRKPVYNYYEKFRNASYKPQVKTLEYFPHQAQGDSSSLNGVEVKRNIRHNAAKLEKEKKAIELGNFTGHGDVNKNLNSRWKYTINGNLEDSGRGYHLTTPVSIAVLPLPDLDRKNSKGRQKGGRHRSISRLTGGGELCPPCQRVRDQTKHFCTSDFVVRASIIGFDFIHGETRYELEVLQSFKNTFPLLTKEYVWSPDTCHCPKLRSGKEYLLMGRSDNSYRRNESRLLVDRSCFVRTYSHKYSRRLLRLRKNQAKKCSSKIS